ncbi:hypothetical protein Tco_1223767 [Tanacetum coccineum]
MLKKKMLLDDVTQGKQQVWNIRAADDYRMRVLERYGEHRAITKMKAPFKSVYSMKIAPWTYVVASYARFLLDPDEEDEKEVSSMNISPPSFLHNQGSQHFTVAAT